MKVLLMAYECSPYRGSEWAVGWGRVLQAARAADVHVITSEANFAALTRARSEHLLPPNVSVHTPPPDAALRALDARPALFAYNYRAYHHWQRLAFAFAQGLHQAERFDVIHQVNVATFREPGYTWRLDAPFLWGPVGGSQNFPMRFLPMLPPIEAAKEAARSVSNWLSLRCKPRVRQAARRAAKVLAANSTNLRDYQRVFKRPINLLLETGLAAVPHPDRKRFEHRAAAQRQGPVSEPIQLLWSGELQTRKALPILLRALAKLGPETPFHCTVLGDGPQRKRWQAASERLGLSNRVTFRGRLPFAEAVAAMQQADIFCFTSLRDTSGNVILEALAAGVPVISFAHQGAGDIVDDRSGVRLSVHSPKQAVHDFAATIRELAVDADRLLKLSHGATARARDFLWESNGDRVNLIYQQLSALRTGPHKSAPATRAE